MASLPVNKTLNKKEMDTIKQSVAILAVLAACPAGVQAQETAVARLIAVNEAFDAALSRKDIEAVDAAWLHGPDATAIHPSSKTPIIGWDAVRKSWEKMFDTFSELSVTLHEPSVHVLGDSAWVIGVETIKGRLTTGQQIEFQAPTTNVYVRQGTGWLMTHHHASRAPQ